MQTEKQDMKNKKKAKGKSYERWAAQKK